MNDDAEPDEVRGFETSGPMLKEEREIARKEKFLMEELRNATKLTYHIDSLRNNLTSFFLTFIGAAVAGVVLALKTTADVSAIFTDSIRKDMAIVLLIIGVLGVTFVTIMARLRRAQIEHFRIVNNIREHFLGDDYRLQNVVQLSKATLPMPTRTSGTYFWLLIIIIANASVFAAASHLSTADARLRNSGWLTLCVFVAAMVVMDAVYFHLARPPRIRDYTPPAPQPPPPDAGGLKAAGGGGAG